MRTVDSIANSPEVNIIGAIAGGDVQKNIKDGQEIIHNIATNPLIVGSSLAENNLDKGLPVVVAIQAID